ncbi:MAG: hypothetical protein HYX95_01885 [Chloroflexi bacterium]|nr:hypothetical protein [Chloroflexota bacterium]
MMRFKGCPRCEGDLFFDWDFYGWYEQCIQCGHMRYLEAASRTTKTPRTRKKEMVRAA